MIDAQASWWERQKIIIAVIGWRFWLYYSLRLDKPVDCAIEWVNYIRNREYYEKMDYRFACVIDHATGGKASKTNYDKETYYSLIDEHVQEMCESYLEDAIADGEVKQVRR